MTRTPEQGAPKYRQIADQLKAGIDSGRWPRGTRLPALDKLAEEHGAAINTIRAAINVLQADGLVTVQQGAGVFVKDFRRIVRNATERLSARQWGSGRSIWEADLETRPMAVDSITVREGVAPDRVAYVLDTEQVWIRDRRYLVEDRPVMLATSYLPAELVAGTRVIQPDPGPGGIYARLDDLGLKPMNFEEQVRARMPSAEEARRLSLSNTGVPVLWIVRVAYAASGQPVEVNEMILDATVYVLQYDFTS